MSAPETPPPVFVTESFLRERKINTIGTFDSLAKAMREIPRDKETDESITDTNQFYAVITETGEDPLYFS